MHEILAWERIGKWDFYPEDHIARLKGSVKASEGFEATSVGPRTEPRHLRRLDNLPAGNNDFCSTKHSVRQASLSDGNGSIFSIEGEGKTHIRCHGDQAREKQPQMNRMYTDKKEDGFKTCVFVGQLYPQERFFGSSSV